MDILRYFGSRADLENLAGERIRNPSRYFAGFLLVISLRLVLESATGMELCSILDLHLSFPFFVGGLIFFPVMTVKIILLGSLLFGLYKDENREVFDNFVTYMVKFYPFYLFPGVAQFAYYRLAGFATWSDYVLHHKRSLIIGGYFVEMTVPPLPQILMALLMGFIIFRFFWHFSSYSPRKRILAALALAAVGPVFIFLEGYAPYCYVFDRTLDVAPMSRWALFEMWDTFLVWTAYAAFTGIRPGIPLALAGTFLLIPVLDISTWLFAITGMGLMSIASRLSFKDDLKNEKKLLGYFLAFSALWINIYHGSWAGDRPFNVEVLSLLLVGASFFVFKRFASY